MLQDQTEILNKIAIIHIILLFKKRNEINYSLIIHFIVFSPKVPCCCVLVINTGMWLAHTACYRNDEEERGFEATKKD